jgi:hypothetical protein
LCISRCLFFFFKISVGHCPHDHSLTDHLPGASPWPFGSLIVNLFYIHYLILFLFSFKERGGFESGQ